MRKNSIIPVGGLTKIIATVALLLMTMMQAQAQITVTATAGTLGPTVYTQLRLAFNAINAGTHQGAITISVTASTVEAAVAQLNSGTTLPASYTSVLIKPAAATAPIIQGNLAGNGVIYLRGASNVTIDGSNTVGGTSRDLTLRNTTATAGSAVVRFGSASAAIGCNNNTVKNCLVNMNGSTIGIAITSGSGVTLFAIGEAPHSNNTIQNNAITACQTAMYSYGPAGLDANWTIKGNDLNTLGFSGVTLYNGTGTSIVENVINNVSINGATETTGIILSWAAVNTTIARNKISNIANTVANGSFGIYTDVDPAVSGNINIFNNFVLNPTCPASANLWLNAHGIYTDAGTGMNVHHNTVQLATNTAAGATNACMTYDPFAAGMIPAGAVNTRDNILSNVQTTGNRYCLYSTAAAGIFTAVDYNDYVSASGNLGFIGGTNRTTIAAMQAGFGGNVNSINFTPLFVSGTDLHLQQVLGNAALATGTPIGTITTDIDVLPRNTARPTMGAHELTNRIIYTALTGTCSDVSTTLNPVTIESPVGINIAGALIPRIYFRKGVGAWFSAPGTFVSGTATNSTWSFAIDFSVVGGVVGGDVISYYIIGQTNAGAMVFSNPLNGLVAANVNTVTTHPTTPNTFTINTVDVSGLVTSQSACFSTLAQTVPYTYSGSTGTPNQYTLIWSPAGPTNVPAFAALPAGAVNAGVPALTPSGTYTATLTVRNSVTTCSKVYTVTLTITALPVAGPTSVCSGSTNVYTGTPGGGTWSSSNTAVGTIAAASGSLTALSNGSTTLTYALPSGCIGTINVTVAAPPGPISGGGAICPGATLSLTNSSVGGSWSSSAPLTASVDATSGVVIGITQGNATIIYSVAGCTPATTVVTVHPTPNPITGTMYACEGATTTLSTTSTGGTWISSTPTVATVGSTTGVVSGVAAGSTVITYKFTGTGCEVTNTVNVHPTPPAITGGTLVCQGSTIPLSNALPGGTWGSTLPGIISVVATGPGTADATANATSGTTTITYTMPTSCYTTQIMTVSPGPTVIGGSSHVICSGNTLVLTNGTAGGTWSTSNPAVATVSTTGIVYAVAGGVVTIGYVTTSCNPATYTITVNQTPAPITGTITLCNGGSSTTVTNTTTGGVWAMNSLPAATITSLGTIGGVATANITGLVLGGTYAVTYTVPSGCYVIAPIIVDQPAPPIAGPDSVCMGATATLSNIDTTGVWSSSSTAIATIGATGVVTSGVNYSVVTGVSYGVVTISYTRLSGCARTKALRVRVPLPAGVTITRSPSMDTLCAGVPVTFTAHHVNGGAAPGYIWQKFGVDVFTGDSVYVYTPTHGDVISVFMQYSTDVCSYPSPAYAQIPLNIYPNVVPMVTISTTTPSLSAVYMGQVITFFAEVTSGGGSQTYQWFVDGESVPGATNSSYAHSVYNNDTVYCRVNGNPPCDLGSIGISNSIVIQGDYLGVNGVAGVGGNLALFPNPNNGTFTLRGTLNGGNTATYDVVNVIGQTVHKGNITAKNGEVEEVISVGKGLNAGTYMLRINSDTDNKVFHFVITE